MLTITVNDCSVVDVTRILFHSSTDAGCWSKFQRFFFFIIYNPYVVLFVIICIILNTLCMALDHHNMSIGLEKILRVANIVSL